MAAMKNSISDAVKRGELQGITNLICVYSKNFIMILKYPIRLRWGASLKFELKN